MNQRRRVLGVAEHVDERSPWPYMEAMVTRRDPFGKIPGQLGEPITVEQAIRIFTVGGARVMLHEKETGSIEEGK